MNAYAQVGARLVERGYSAIPIMPGTKRPGSWIGGEWRGMTDWRVRFTTRLPTDFEITQWGRPETGGVCVVTGPASKYLVGIDIDTDDAAIKGAITSVLPPTTVRKAGAKGETLLYLCPEMVKLPSPASFNINKVRVCDIIGPGRQMVLPPSIHPDTGQPYRWTGPDALEDMNPDELPVLPGNVSELIAEALKAHGYEAEPPRTSLVRTGGSDDDASPHRKLNDAAMANLDAWIPKLGLYRCKRARGGYEAVAHWRPSSGGRPMEKRKPNLKINPDGIRDFGDADKGYTPLDLVMASHDCDLDTAFGALANWVGWTTETQIALTAPRDAVVAADGAVIDAESGEVIEESQADDSGTPDYLKTFLYPGDPLRPPGLLGDIVEWILATSRKPNRPLALAAAIAIIGTVCGRHLAGPTRSPTNLFIACIGDTAIGKDRPLKATGQILRDSGFGALAGTGKFKSDTALENMILENPVVCAVVDEIGMNLFSKMSGARATSHETGIGSTMRELWSAGFGPWTTNARAGLKAATVEAPSLTIFGASTTDEFYNSISGKSIDNGFINRFLILRAAPRSKSRDPVVDPMRVPKPITDKLQAIIPPATGNMGALQVLIGHAAPEYHVIRFRSSQAHALYSAFEEAILQWADNDKVARPFLGRTAEMGIRLATIRAVGIANRHAEVDEDDVRWGATLALLSARIMIDDVRAHMSENDYQAKYKLVLRIVTESNGGTITKSDLYKRIDGRINKQEQDNILSQLVEGKRIEQRSYKNPKGGRTLTLYCVPGKEPVTQ